MKQTIKALWVEFLSYVTEQVLFVGKGDNPNTNWWCPCVLSVASFSVTASDPWRSSGMEGLKERTLKLFFEKPKQFQVPVTVTITWSLTEVN